MVNELMRLYGYTEEHAKEIVEMYGFMGMLDDLQRLIDAKRETMAIQEDV